MCYPKYSYPEGTILLIRETASLENQRARKRSANWSDTELAAIRVVLHKLTNLRTLNSNDAEDLVQDTLMTMLIKHPENELEKGLLVWSMGILRKKLGNYYRKAQRYTSLDEQGKSGQKQMLRALPKESPEVKLRYQELRTLVDDIITTFPPLQRQAMELLLTGLEVSEIAQQLHPVRYQNVINRLHRGRKRLIKELAKFGYDSRPIRSSGKSKGQNKKAAG